MSNVRIGGNSVVLTVIPDDCIVAGAPAKIVGTYKPVANKSLNVKKYTLKHTKRYEHENSCCRRSWIHRKPSLRQFIEARA